MNNYQLKQIQEVINLLGFIDCASESSENNRDEAKEILQKILDD